MNKAEKEQYLRDYEVLKKKGKPFFPYAVLKDATMALVVALVIVGLFSFFPPPPPPTRARRSTRRRPPTRPVPTGTSTSSSSCCA
jgi:quinol-cytochrome oxidoreductase complex cytochrome b subunit